MHSQSIYWDGLGGGENTGEEPREHLHEESMRNTAHQ